MSCVVERVEGWGGGGGEEEGVYRCVRGRGVLAEPAKLRCYSPADLGWHWVG